MKKIIILILSLLSINLYSQTVLNIKEPESINEYLISKGINNLDIQENNRILTIKDRSNPSGTTETIFRVNRVLEELNNYSNRILKVNMTIVTKEIRYNYKSTELEMNEEWIKKYYSDIDLIQKSKMLSEVVIPDLNRYREINE